MENSKIEWTDHTWNPWVGCTKVSPACDNCYAESWAKRSGNPELWQGVRRMTRAANWSKPYKWNEGSTAGRRQRVFCASLADVFDNQVPPEWRAEVWQVIADTPRLQWLLLTKRPQNISKMLPDGWGKGWPNVWLGTTVENQIEADRRIPHLLSVPARIHFLSVEPMLERINLHGYLSQADWIICGGESGPGCRPFDPEWARDLRDQCEEFGVPFFMKQMGGVRKPFRAIPDDLMIRQWPD